MKVLLVVPGTEGRNDILSSVLGAVGESDAMELVTLDAGSGPLSHEASVLGFPVHSLGPSASLTAAVRLRRVIRRAAPDVVQAHGYMAGWVLALSSLAVTRGPALQTVRHHNLFHHLARSRTGLLRDRFTIRRMDSMVASSSSVGDVLLAEGCRSGRLTHATNGRDWSDAPVRTDLDRGGGATDRRRRILAIGNLKIEKDYPTLLRAVARLVESEHDLEVVIAGTGSASAEAELKNLAAELRIEDRLVLAGWVADVFTLIRRVDVVAHVSVDEASPQAVYEAAGIGVPVVATSSGGIRDILGPHQELAPPGDDQMIADMLAAALDDPKVTRRALEIAGDIRHRYSADRCGRSYLDACRTAVRITTTGLESLRSPSRD